MNVPTTTQALQLPAHLAAFQSQKLSKTVTANIGSSAPPYVSIQGNRFNLIDAAGNEQPVGAFDASIGVYLDCTVVDVNEHLSKVYYTDKFDPGAQNYQPPICWSDNGIGPSRQASTPQNALCGPCKWNEWGSKTSAVTGKGVRACADQQKIAVMVAGFPTPFLLRIPPASLKNFGAYAGQFAGQQFDMDLMVTRLSFEQQGVGMLLFNAVGWIDEAVAGAIAQLRQNKATDAMIGRNDLPIDQARMIVSPAGGVTAAAEVHTPASGLRAESRVSSATPVLDHVAGFAPNPGYATNPQPFAQGGTTAVYPPLPAGPAQQSVPAAQPPAEPQRRRRRTQAEMQAAQNGVPQPPATPPQAPFPHAPPPGQPAPAPQPAPPPQANFGMATPPAPDPGLTSILQSVFGIPQR